MSRKGRLHALLPGLLIALFLLAAVEWSLSVPPYEAPDETGHARYVDFLRLHRRLPLAGEEAPGEAHQPPLYYALAALAAGAAGLPALDAAPRKNPSFVWYGGSDQAKYLHDDSETPPLAGSAAGLHWLRFLSVLMAAPAVWLFHRIAAAGAGAAGPAPIAAAGLAAFLPQFTFISGSLNNDNLANLLSAGCFALLAAAVARPAPTARWLLAGLCAGLALASKFTCLTLIPAGAIALGLAPRPVGARATRAALAFLAPALLLPAPLLARNALVLGDPVGVAAQMETLSNLLDRKTLLSGYFVTEFPSVLFRSF